MNFKDVNVIELKKHITIWLEGITCINCCKYYSAPTTATCGHTLCKKCWARQKACACCALKVNTKALRLNIPLENLTTNTILLRNALTCLYDIDLDASILGSDGPQYVKDWLDNSENRFSAPVTQSTPPEKPSNQITSDIQIHTYNPKVETRIETRPEMKTIQINYQQEDWDKIEQMPEIERSNNPRGPMDLETFDSMDDKDKDQHHYIQTCRRSLRKKEPNTFNAIINENSLDKENCTVSKNIKKKLSKVGKNWQNVTKMKKNVTKLNKKNKLNTSIVTVKSANHTNKGIPSEVKELSYNMDENTPENAKEIATKSTNFNSNNEINSDISKSQSINTKNTNYITNKVQNNSSNANVQKAKQIDIEMQNQTEKDIQIKDGGTSKICFFKKGPLHVNDAGNFNNDPTIKNKNTIKNDTENIEITIKIGKTVANICIQQKENDVKVNVNSDRAVQTSLGTSEMDHKNEVHNSLKRNYVNVQTSSSNNNKNDHVTVCTSQTEQVEKSQSTKKNTTSADTTSAHFEISESEQKEFENHMVNITLKEQDNIECQKSTHVNSNRQVQRSLKSLEAMPEDAEVSSDADIFDGKSVKEGNVQPLPSTSNTPSAILMPTVRSKLSLQKQVNKRLRDDSENPSNNKKVKITQNNGNEKTQTQVIKENIMEAESENINYDAIMSQVFANINADMENMHTANGNQLPTQISNTQKSTHKNCPQPKKANVEEDKINKKPIVDAIQICSENVFSSLEREDANLVISKATNHEPLGLTQPLKENTLPPTISPDYDLPIENKEVTSQNAIDLIDLGTPIQDDDEKSVVEETPQKQTSFLRSKSSHELCSNAGSVEHNSNEKCKSLNKTSNQQYYTNTKAQTISNPTRKSALETPITITKFVNEVQHKSTPMAKKSLDFSHCNDVNDPEETLCPSSVVAANTTQEREFMSKAFEQSLETQNLYAGRHRMRNTKLCVACSCLSVGEQTLVRNLCLQRNWKFVEKYTKELTHLVVRVDEENKSERTVKYICALASAKWIVSLAWVEKCSESKGFVDEEPFEALDVTGQPGPRRSRLAKQKLFQGFTFYCMPPFTILDIDNLKYILESTGGRVVSSPREVRATEAPALLLAEPEQTQVNRFIYLAMELKIVPMNYEWILNCLGSYTLKPILDLLLCPATLLPPVVEKWPTELITMSEE